jgi:AsmA protein
MFRCMLTGRRGMKKLLIAVGAVVVLLIAAGVLAPFFISADAYKGQIVARLRDATGRDLRIAGPLSLSLFPNVQVEANDVSVGNPPGAQSETMAKLPKLDLSVRLVPLLSGRIEIEHLTLVDPVIDLEIDAHGRPNWSIAASGTAAGNNAETAGLAALSRLEVKDVTIRNGTVMLLDRRNNDREELKEVSLTLSLPRPGAPFAAAGSEVWRGEKIAFSVRLDRPDMLARQSGRSDMTVSLTSKPITVQVTGGVINALSGATPAPVFDGKADIAMPSLRDFVTWSGRDIALPKHGFGALALSGAIHAENGIARFTDAKFALDAIQATGTVALDLSDLRPKITAALATGMLDLNPYLPPPVPGWNTDKFDDAVFRGVDADVTVAARGVRFRKLQIGPTDVSAHLKDAKLTLDVARMALYRGGGKGRVDIDATGPVAAVRIDGTVSGVDIAALARDAAGIEGVAGSGTFTLAGTAHGNSERDLIASLAGHAAFRMTNGAVGGVDLGGMLKNAAGAFSAGAGRTAIGRASADYTITRGIMLSNDLSVSTDAIDATGAGTVNLPARTLNYRITPRLVAGIVTVPVIVSGPWDHLSYRPDLAGIAKGVVLAPVNVLGGAAGVGKNVGQGIGNGVGGALKSLFGN